MTHHHTPEKIPTPLLLGCGALMLFSVFAAAVAPVFERWAGPAEEPAIVKQTALRFHDEPGGAITVYHADENQPITTLAPGEGGFVRTAMRAIVYKRRQHGLGPEVPFELIATADGSLILLDPATDQKIKLDAFGADNRASFAALLTQAETIQ